jgi:hypothetical protein
MKFRELLQPIAIMVVSAIVLYLFSLGVIALIRWGMATFH